MGVLVQLATVEGAFVRGEHVLEGQTSWDEGPTFNLCTDRDILQSDPWFFLTPDHMWVKFRVTVKIRGHRR